MKILTIANEKGGVGKTMISTQFAFYAALKFGCRVAVIDLDQQSNCSNCLKAKSYCKSVEGIKACDLLLSDKSNDFNNLPEFALFDADDRLSLLEKQGDSAHGQFADTLIANLKALTHHFDLVVIDTNPNPDIRSNLGLIACTHLVSPIQLTKEPIDGISRLFDRLSLIQTLNPNLPDGFLGMLPNAIESGKFQVNNAQELMSQFGKLLIKEESIAIACKKNEKGVLVPAYDSENNIQLVNKTSYAGIKRHAAIAEAQANGSPFWLESNCADAWSESKKAFFSIYEGLHLDKESKADEADIALLNECKSIYGEKSFKAIIRQFFMSDSTKLLPKLPFEKVSQLRELKKKISLDFLVNF